MYPKNSKILICDDSPISRAVLIRILKEFGFENLYEAEGAVDVIEMLIEKNTIHFDLLLLDIVMPDLPGTELVKVIRKSKSKFQDMSIIMVSSEGDKKTVLKALVNGANEYLLKPVESTSVLSKMGNVWKKLPENKKSNIILRASSSK